VADAPSAPPAPVPTETPTSSPTPSRTPTETRTPVSAPATGTPTNTPVPVSAPTKQSSADAPPNTGGSGTTAGALELASTYRSVSVYANFAGDSDGDNKATLQYRKAGDATWRTGMDMTPDRRATVFGANSSYPNPFKNQWRASVLMAEPNTDYEVRVTFTDVDGMTGPDAVTATIRTRDENPPSTGRTLYVAPDGADSNAGTEAAPFRTLQKAADAVAAGDTVLVRAGTYAPVSIKRSGTATNFISFKSHGDARPVVTGPNGTLVTIGGSYVRFGGFELVGATWGVRVITPAQHVIVEGNIVRGQKFPGGDVGGVPIEIGDSFSEQNPVANVTVRNNDLRADTLPEPQSEVILVKAASGGHVIAGNRMVFSYQGGNVHGTDCVGGLPNFAPHGGFFKDTDVYDNYCEGATDEGVEIDGGNANIRVWNNTIVKANIGFSITPVYYGPVYVFRNVVRDLADHWVGSCAGVKDGESGNGAVYFFHNTFYAPSGAACKNIVKGFAKYGGDDSQDNVVAKNNVLHFWGRLHETGVKTFDYNLDFVEPASKEKTSEWNGTDYWGWDSYRAGTGQEAHGIWGRATFVDAAGGDLRLAPGSLGIDSGATLPGFNDADSAWPHTGSAPDIGAFEQ
jgi:hypothetical protein